MGDTRFQSPYRWIKEAKDTAAAIQQLGDEEVIAALAAASRHQDPYFANVLATEALNRTVQKNAIVTNAGEGMYAVNRMGCITYLNPAAERMLGCKLDDAAGRHVHEVLNVRNPRGGTMAPGEDPALAAMRIGGSVHLEGSTIHRRDGSVFPVAATAAPIHREGEIEGAVVVFSDITERQRGEEVRRETEGRLRAVVTYAPIVLFALDPDGVFTLFEGKGMEHIGVKPEDVLGRSIFDLHPENTTLLGHARRALAGEAFSSTDEVDQRIFEKHWAPIRKGEGPLEGTICVAVDVTERVRAERAQQASEERYRSLFDHHPDAISSTDLEGRIVTVNRAFVRLLGWSRGEVKGHRFGEFVDPTDLERVERALSTFGTDAHGIEFAMVARDGRRVDVRGVAVPMLVDGILVGFHGMVQDISEHKESERELRESRESLRRIVNSLPEAVLILDAGGGIRLANDAAVQLLGRPREEIVGVRFDDPRWEVATAEGPPIAPRELPLYRAIEGGDVVTGFVCTVRRSDGTRPVVRASIVPTRGAGGEISGAVVSLIDITQGARAETRLREREEAYRALAENSPDLIARIDHRMRHVYVNQAFVAATGLPKEAALGRTCAELGVFGDSTVLLEDRIRRVLRRAKTETVEHVLATPDGGRRIETRLVPEFSETGAVRGVLAVSRDVTKRKLREETLAGANRELTDQMEHHTRRLVEALGDLKAFAVISRESLLRPLETANSILRELERGERGPIPTSAREAIARALAENAAALESAERLLELRRVAAADVGEARPVSLRDVLASPAWAERCGHIIEGRVARIDADLEAAPRILAPPDALAGMLGDLVLDLLAWADPGTPVVALRSVASPVRAGWVELDVEINGAGFPPGALALLGEPEDAETWVRRIASDEKLVFRLALHRRLARRLGGSLRLKHARGGAAAIQLALPMADP